MSETRAHQIVHEHGIGSGGELQCGKGFSSRYQRVVDGVIALGVFDLVDVLAHEEPGYNAASEVTNG